MILEGVLENNCPESYQVKLAVKIFEKYFWKSLLLLGLQAFRPLLYAWKWTYSEVFQKGFGCKFQNAEAVTGGCSLYKTGKEVYLSTLQNSQENTCVGVSFPI